MTDYLATLGVSIEKFYRELRDIEEQPDYQTNLFIECLIASTTYESFYRVMARAGLKKKEKIQLTGSGMNAADEKMSSSAKYTTNTQQRAEAKGSNIDREEKSSK